LALDVEKTADFGGVEEYLTIANFNRKASEMRTFTRPTDAEAVAWLISRPVGRTHEVSAARIPQFSGFAIIEPHRQVPAFILIGANPTVRQPQEDTLLFEGSFVVFEPQTFGRDIIEYGETLHSENGINAS
jgi:hypothetical protein